MLQKEKKTRNSPCPDKKKIPWRCKRFFFGWRNIRWFIREIGKVYSGQPSYFSKKRVESGISFFIGQLGMILFMFFRYDTITMEEFIMWASLEFAVGGYITYQIQRQKRYQWGDDNGWGGRHGYWRKDCDEYYQEEHNEEITTGGPGEQEDPEPEPPNSTNFPI